MAQSKPREPRTEACGIMFVIETNPDQTTDGYPQKKVYTFEFLLRQRGLFRGLEMDEKL